MRILHDGTSAKHSYTNPSQGGVSSWGREEREERGRLVTKPICTGANRPSADQNDTHTRGQKRPTLTSSLVISVNPGCLHSTSGQAPNSTVFQCLSVQIDEPKGGGGMAKSMTSARSYQLTCRAMKSFRSRGVEFSSAMTGIPSDSSNFHPGGAIDALWVVFEWVIERNYRFPPQSWVRFSL